MTEADLDDLMFVRRPLEDLMATALTGRRVEEADEALARMTALPGDAPWADVVAEHMALHQALIVAVGSPRLERLYTALAVETRLGLVRLRTVYSDRHLLVAEHRDLLDRIGQGPPEAARRAVAAHLDHGWGTHWLPDLHGSLAPRALKSSQSRPCTAIQCRTPTFMSPKKA
ncbi:FCD domain-containing protein [Streptosporangium lutulentum]